MLFSQNFDATKLQSGAYLSPHNVFLFRVNFCHRIKIRTATKRKCSLPEQIHFSSWGIFFSSTGYFPEDRNILFHRTEIFCFTGQKYSVSQDGNIFCHSLCFPNILEPSHPLASDEHQCFSPSPHFETSAATGKKKATL